MRKVRRALSQSELYSHAAHDFKKTNEIENNFAHDGREQQFLYPPDSREDYSMFVTHGFNPLNNSVMDSSRRTIRPDDSFLRQASYSRREILTFDL